MNKSLPLFAVLCFACATPKTTASSSTVKALPDAPAGAKVATALLQPKSGSSVEGAAQFVEQDGKVTLTLKLKNLAAGPHAVHLHDKGDCSAPDAASAGPHWNPGEESHGQWGHPPHHLGDVGNVEITNDGHGTIDLTTDKWSIGTGQPNDILNHALVVHANADDYKSQPAGNAGVRVACGVVTLETAKAQ